MKIRIHFDQLLDCSDPGTLRAFGRALPAASLAAGVAFWEASSRGVLLGVLAAVVAFVVVEALAGMLVLATAEGGARAMMSVVGPSGGSTPRPVG